MPAAWMSVGGTSRPFTASLPHSHIPLLFSVILALLVPAVQPLLNYGCTLSEDLCEEGEVCANDGLFGQCYAPDSGLPAPSVLGDLDDTQLELLRLELTRLVRDDLDWQDARSQCVIAYFKLSTSYDLQYDPDFCAVRNPANIWALVQLIEIGLNGDDEGAETANVGELIERLADAEPSRDEVEGEETELEDDDETPTSGDPVVEAKIREILADSDSNVDFSELSDAQLNELIARIYRIKNAIREADATGELEEAVPLDALTPEQAQLILKKDAEELGNTDNGLEGKEHKIVKGRETPAVSRVIGNRIYLKVNISDEEQLYPLIDFLQNTIALPNNLLFDDFQYDKGQLSLRISRAIGGAATLKKGGEKRIDSVEGVAQAVYKRRKDIQRFSGAKVAETGIGMGEESVPVESEERDWIVQPVLFICAFTIAALVTVLAVHAARTYRRRRPSNPSDLPHLVEQVETKSSRAYEDLCRQRMSQEPAPQSAHGSKSSSTSSWCGDETAAGPSLDISTGHVLLKFLQDFIDEPARISEQWDTVKDYENITKSRNVAAAHPDSERLVDPYDESLVSVTDAGENAFLNASLLYDDAPRQPLYVAAESPRAGQAAAFWHAVWDQSVVLIVNLNTAAEVKEQRAYWPSSGSEVHGAFEIHLVSEHIWSEDYVVRSFYLKNLRNSQTRTVTQFHFLSWPKDGVPASAAALLEFRRKVNKSYRGRGSPLLVESASGAGRVGTFILLDVAVSRIQRGVKQIDLAASLEHLRDQRPGLVRTLDQYKLVFACVAQEVSQLVKALPQ